MTERYRIHGGPGSPYSHKVRAVLRYRRIPHDWVIVAGGFDGTAMTDKMPDPTKRLLPIVQYPDGTCWNDSTPIIEELDRAIPGREVVPPSPADRFLARLIEDFADEYLCFILMAYRWTSDEDVAFCGRRQMSGWYGAISEDELAEAIARMSERQQRVRDLLAQGEGTREIFDSEYRALLEILEEAMGTQLFLFGDRPSIADFGLYGMLSQFAADPTPLALMRANAVRTWQWIQYADDLSGHDGAWGPRSPAVAKLAALAAKTFLPMMTAVSEAVANNEQPARYEAYGVPMISFARPYPANCWLWLKALYRDLPDDARADVDRVTGPAFASALLMSEDEEKRLVPFAKI